MQAIITMIESYFEIMHCWAITRAPKYYIIPVFRRLRINLPSIANMSTAEIRIDIKSLRSWPLKKPGFGFVSSPVVSSVISWFSSIVTLRHSIQFKSFRQKENLNNSNLFLIQMRELMTHPSLIQKWISRFIC